MNRSPRTYTVQRPRRPVSVNARQDEMTELVLIWAKLGLKGTLEFYTSKDTTMAQINLRGHPGELSSLLAALLPAEPQEDAA